MHDDDHWLERWLPMLAERATGRPVLELGCGTGRDTAVLLKAGHSVLAIDRSLASITVARVAARGATFVRQDLREPWPVQPAGYGAVIASLSLHYFSWAETERLVQRIRDSLSARGVLICRLNSTRDHHFGASGHRSIEENYFDVNGEPKRFFDRPAIERVFGQGWTISHVEESVIDRYHTPKAVWLLQAEAAT